MKLSLIVTSALLMLGCAKTVPPPVAKPVAAPIHRATAEDCGRVYGQIISIALTEQLEPEQLFSKEVLEAGAQQLDDFYTRTGRKQLFFLVCQSKFNVNQTSCMVKAQDLDSMDICEQLYK